MNNQDTINQLYNLLQQMQMRLQLMQHHSEAIPDIEWQLLLNDASSFYDKALFAKNRNSIASIHEEKNIKQTDTPLDETTIESLSAKFPSLNQVLKKETSIEQVSELNIEKGNITKSEMPEVMHKNENLIFPPKANNENVNISGHSKENNVQNIAEKYKTDQKTINDSLHNSINSIGIKMQHQPIGDIKKAIGLNEKFLFIKELFNNNEQGYYEAIDELNHCDSYQNAVEKMNVLANTYQWVQESPICLKLHDLLKRRYIR